MAMVSVTRVVPVPVARVWTVFTDLRARADWLSAVADVEVLTSGGFGTGTAWRETRTMPDGERTTEEFRVLECDAPARLVVASPGSGVDYRITYTFTPIWPRPAPVRRARRGSGRRRSDQRGSGQRGSGQRGPADATAVTVTLEGTASRAASKLLAFVLGGLAARVVTGTLRQDLTDLAAAAA